MVISTNELKHLSQLSCLKFSSIDLERIGKDLNNIIDYVEQLKEVDTKNIDPLISVNEQKTPFRPDIPEESLEQEDALRNAPERNSDYFKVPKVLG